METGQNITAKQNEADSINKLAAQKQLYRNAKSLFILQIVLTVPVIVTLSVLKFLLLKYANVDISAYTAIYSIALSLFDLVLINKAITDNKVMAARIQELFDCYVLNLPWNSVCTGKKPEIEKITKYSRLFKNRVKDLSKITNWYPIEIQGMDASTATLVCQRTNLNYDRSIRESFKVAVRNTAIFVFAVIIFSSIYNTNDLKDFIVNILLVSLPVLILFIKIFQDQNKSITALTELKTTIDTIQIGTDEVFRQIQDKIFVNRKESGLIPEWYYDMKRDKLEAEMHENAQ